MLHLLALGLSLASSLPSPWLSALLGRDQRALLLSGGLQLLWYSRAALALGALVCCTPPRNSNPPTIIARACLGGSEGGAPFPRGAGTRLFAMLLLNPRLGVLILSCARMYQDVRRRMRMRTRAPTPTLAPKPPQIPIATPNPTTDANPYPKPNPTT